MSILLKAAITLTVFLCVYYGYLKAEEDDFYGNPAQSEDPLVDADPIRLKVMRFIFVALCFVDFISLMICLWW